LRGAAEANPEIPRFARNRLRNPRSKLEIATLSVGKLAMTKKTKILGKLNYYSYDLHKMVTIRYKYKVTTII